MYEMRLPARQHCLFYPTARQWVIDSAVQCNPQCGVVVYVVIKIMTAELLQLQPPATEFTNIN